MEVMEVMVVELVVMVVEMAVVMEVDLVVMEANCLQYTNLSALMFEQ